MKATRSWQESRQKNRNFLVVLLHSLCCFQLCNVLQGRAQSCHRPLPCLPTGLDVFVAERASGSDRSFARPPECESDGQTHRRRFRQCLSLDRFQRRRARRQCGGGGDAEGQAGRRELKVELPDSVGKFNLFSELGPP